MRVVFLTLLLCISSSSALQGISDEDYARMPPIHHVDRFGPCVERPGGAYCTAKADLNGEGDNEIYGIITNYTTIAPRHFNYSNIMYGFCVTSRCKEYYKGDSDEQLKEAMEECLDNYFQREYGLRSTLVSQTCYRYNEKKYTPDAIDQTANIISLTLFILVIFGTLYDLLVPTRSPKGFLMCFSLPANWKVLKEPWPKEGIPSRLLGINCMRTITSMLVIVGHGTIPLLLTLDNTKYIEDAFERQDTQVLLHTQIAMQTFFVFAGLFLTLTLKSYSERKPLQIKDLPRAILMRWLRLSPVHLFMLLITMSWLRYTSVGPVWQEMVGTEVQDCRTHWLSVVFSYNNYVDNMQCGLEHWSTALDFQLYTIGLTIMYLSPTPKIRNVIIWFIIIIGMIFPAYETYVKDLDGNLLIYAKTIRDPSIMVQNPTYRYLYRRTHTNMSCFFMGMGMGLILFNILKNPIDEKKYKKYAVFYWLLVPAMFWLSYSNSYLFLDTERPPMYLRLLFTIFHKPAWAIVLFLLILGLVYRVENVYRRVMEWPGWVPLTRLTFCTYNVHVPLIKAIGSGKTTLQYLSDGQALCIVLGYIAVTFLVSLFLWLIVEAPIANVIRYLFPEKKSVVRDVEKKTE